MQQTERNGELQQAAHPARACSDADAPPAAHGSAATPDANGGPQTIGDVFAQRARAHPQRVAVIDGAQHVDYARLSARADAIAQALLARGVEPGALVGVCVGRTWELAAALLGVLRAGAAYVPLDPDYPRDRVRYMLGHARAALAIVDDAHAAALCEDAPQRLRLDEVRDAAAPVPLPEAAATDLAYVIYTSGSTGRPKGVAVEHRSVLAMTRAMRTLLDEADLDGVLAAASCCFDPSVMELLGTLCLGGTVVLAPNALALAQLPAADRVRTAIMVPSSMQALLAGGWRPLALRCVVLGGETLSPALASRLHALQPQLRVFNVYGPTEDTVFSTAAAVPPGAGEVTIGRPVAGTQCHILDAALQPVPAGVPGELHLAGDKLARGYLHDPERTCERFVEAAPGPGLPVQRLYRTGDLCRWNAQGEIEFLGRMDAQVKLRGFRIELEEVESALLSLPGVDAAAAAVVETGDGRRMLAGYVVSRDPDAAGEAARAHVARCLPRYMVPQQVVRVASLPRLPNGKLDRSRLAPPDPPGNLAPAGPDAPQPGRSATDPGAPPASRLAHLPMDERRSALLAIVRGEIAQVLGLRDPARIPADGAVETLGLDSLDSVELSHRLATAVGRPLPASLVNAHPTPAALAGHLLALLADGDTMAEAPAPVRGTEGDPLGRLQAELRSGHPPFLAARASAWSASDRATLVGELKRLQGRSGRDPYGKFLSTGSAARGTVADTHSGEAREAIIWTTNLYLGLNRDPEVMAQARSALERFGTGMGTSATASGQTGLHLAFEQAFAQRVGKPAACLFPTGFTANLGAIAGLLGEQDVVVMDQLCHASIVDGARLSGARLRTFRHNSADDLAAILQAEASPYRTTLVVLEGAYSMGEGTAPLREIVQVAKRHGALVLVDEAHSFGFYGPRGAGLCAELGVAGDVDFIMTTLSKALGSLGGVIAASEAHVALLKASSRAYVFQATTTPADIAAALAALERLGTDDALRERLWDTTRYMHRRFTEAGYDLGAGDGPIVTPHIADSARLYAIARALGARGIHTAAVTYPIVERGGGRLRFICSAAHTRDDVDRTLEALQEAEREVDAAASQAPERDAGRTHASAATPATRADLVTWAGALQAYLAALLADTPGPVPSLAVSIALEGDDPLLLRIDGRDVSLAPAAAASTVSCRLLLADTDAAAALCSRDVHALLQRILDGTCTLRGQTEAFVWLFARLAQWQQAAQA